MEVVSGLLLALGPGASGLSFSDNTTHLRGTDQGLESTLVGLHLLHHPRTPRSIANCLIHLLELCLSFGERQECGAPRAGRPGLRNTLSA